MFCPENPDKYCCNSTPKFRLNAIDDWEIIFNAAIRLKPSDIKASTVIDSINSIRACINQARELLKKEIKTKEEGESHV